MGNWRNRRCPRRFYRQDWKPLYHDEPLIPPSGFTDEGVPAWEKKFCAFVGLLPWQKVVDAKLSVYCHKNIIGWDDSAGEEAFHNAKNRFWAKYNGLPCDISLPDPDFYIGEIDWEPEIDPQLVKELEQAFFVPTDEEKEWNPGHRSKKTRNTESEWCSNKNPCSDDNPWKRDNDIQDDVPQNLGHNVNDSGNLDGADNRNPWDHPVSQNNEPAKDGWGDSADQSCGWNQGRGNSDQAMNWWDLKQSDEPAKDNGWHSSAVNNSRGWNQPDSRNLNEAAKKNAWGDSAGQSTNWDNGNNSWDTSQCNNGWDNSTRDWSQPDSKNLNEARKKNGWGDSAGQSCGWNQGRGSSYQSTNWDNGDNQWDPRRSNESANNNEWGSRGVNNTRGWNQQNSRNCNGYNSWGHNCLQDRARGAPNNRGGRVLGGNSWGSKLRDGGGWRNRDMGFQRRGGSHQYGSRHNNARFQGYDYQPDNNHWREANAKKRVSFENE